MDTTQSVHMSRETGLPLLSSLTPDTRWRRKKPASAPKLLLESRDVVTFPIVLPSTLKEFEKTGRIIHLEVRDFIFIWNEEYPDRYTMSATTDLGDGMREYQFTLQFHPDHEKPSCSIRAMLYGQKPEEVVSELALYVGDQLYKCLCSKDGIELCSRMKHSPMHLYEAWSDVARDRLGPDATLERQTPAP